MALRTPPAWLQAGSYTAENDRLIQQAVFNTTGIVGASSLAVTAQASPNMTVNVASGWATVVGGNATNQGVYTAYNDATTVLTVTSADPSLPRIDRVVATVSDAAYSGSANQIVFQVLAGTPNASPTAPSVPTNAISLATISVAAAATTVTTGNITDTRVATVSNLSSFSSLTSAGLITANAGVTTASATKVTLGAGSASVAPLQLTSGTNLTSPVSGAVEFDGTAEYFTPAATSGRGSVAAPYVYNLGNSNINGTNVTTAQPLFPGLTNGLYVQANTLYDFEIVSGYQNTSTAARNNTVTLGGTATFSNVTGHFLYGTTTAYSALSTPGSALFNALSVTFTSTLGAAYFTWRGQFRTNAAGYVQPQITFSVAPVTVNFPPGSFVKITPVTSAANATADVRVGAWS